MTNRDFRAIADQWEDDAINGRVLVGALVVKALERQRAELKNPPDGYTFDDNAANTACAIAEELAWPKGPKRGKRIKLEPWQVWLLRVMFGWVDSAELPRFLKVTIFLPKGNGKSPLAALIGLIVLARGRRIGAKVYNAATTQKQAHDNVFAPAQEMLRLSKDFRRDAGLIVGEHAIKGVGDPRTFEPISAEKRSADGSVGDCYIVDEVHQHPDRTLFDTLTNNASKVEGSRLVVISTAGTDQSPTAIGWITYVEARDILLGKLDQPAHFAFISEADRERDPWAEDTWRQANPNFGVSVFPAGFKALVDSVKQDPGSQPHFFATRLGWWTQGGKAWMDLNKWDAAATTVLDDHFKDKHVVLGLDYAPKLDLTAIVTIGVTLLPDGRRDYTIRSHAYVPKHSPTVRDIPELKQWADEGWVTLTPGDIDDIYLREQLIPLQAQFPTPPPSDQPQWKRGAAVCLDPFGLPALTAWLGNENRPHVEIPQNWKFQSPAMTEIQVALSQGRLHHDGSPVMRMCMANLIGAVDRKGNTTPDRENDSKKIDVAVALINGMSRAMVAELTRPVTVSFMWLEPPK